LGRGRQLDQVPAPDQSVVGHQHQPHDRGYIAPHVSRFADHAANQARSAAPSQRLTVDTVTVSSRGAARWVRGHPWIYRSDVVESPADAGLVRVADTRGKFLGQALHSPRSEIRLRLLERSERVVDAAWWKEALAAALARRAVIDATAYRVVHGEGD